MQEELKPQTQLSVQVRKKGVDLSRFYIRSGVRENCFCVKNPQYRMAPLPTSEARERAGLRGVGYR